MDVDQLVKEAVAKHKAALAAQKKMRTLAAERDVAVYKAYAAGAPTSRLAAELKLKRARTATIRTNGQHAVESAAAEERAA